MATEKALSTAIAFLEKQLGKNIIMDLKGAADLATPHIPTGVIPFDIISGIGGLPVGGIVEMFGFESSGKSTFVLQGPTLSVIKRGGRVLYLDYEHAFDPTYTKSLGVDIEDKDHFLVSQPRTFEDGGVIVRELAENNLIDLVIWDSLAASVPAKDLDPDETEMGESRVGSHSRVAAQILKQLTGILDNSKTTLVFINQIRTKIGFAGSSQTTPGGLAVKFYAKQRFEFVKKEGIKGWYPDEVTGDRVQGIVGTRVKIKCAKNKCAAPFRECEMLMKAGFGFDVFGTALELAVKKGFVVASGRSSDAFEYGDIKVSGEGSFLNELRTKNKLKQLYEQLGWGEFTNDL